MNPIAGLPAARRGGIGDARGANSRSMTASRNDTRNAILCAAACLLTIVLVWPVAEMSFNDDWSFAFTAKRLTETGHIFYNGWSSPSVLSQSYWGALWIKLFGFHFTVLRVSTAPLAAGSAAVSYLIARRAGLIVSSSLLVALSLTLSPLFLPLATSFMSDVPGLFCILLAVYGLVRSADSPTRRGAIAWMIFALIAAATGGSSRQIVWIVPLALLPMVAWLRRRDRLIIAAAAMGWVVTFATATLIQRWFDHQPYALPEPSIGSEIILSSHKPAEVVKQFFAILLTLLMVVLPAGIAVLPRVWAGGWSKSVLWPVLFLSAGFLLFHPYFAGSPWMGNMISPEGILAGGQISGPEPVVLPPAVWVAISLGVYVIVASLLAMAISTIVAGRRAIRELVGYFLDPPAGATAGPAVVLVTVSYLSLLLTRCALDFAYDRHVMPLIPLAAIPPSAAGTESAGFTSAASPDSLVGGPSPLRVIRDRRDATVDRPVQGAGLGRGKAVGRPHPKGADLGRVRV